jgi:hypothetical protein
VNGPTYLSFVREIFHNMVYEDEFELAECRKICSGKETLGNISTYRIKLISQRTKPFLLKIVQKGSVTRTSGCSESRLKLTQDFESRC